MIEKIKKAFSDPLEIAVAVSGLGLLGFYYFYARKQLGINKNGTTNKHNLNMSIHDLVTKTNDDNIVKIVITEGADSNSRQFSSKLVTRLKEFLLSNQITTLVNCSPLKLFKAGAQVFTNTLPQEISDADDVREMMSYYENALKCQLIIQRTIVDIQQIKNKDKKSFLICDTNSIDLKIKANPKLWADFLQKQNIKQTQLMSNYQIVFHIKYDEPEYPPGFNEEVSRKASISISHDDKNEKIINAWRGFPNYYIIQYDERLIFEQNVEEAIEKMVHFMRPFLPYDARYTKRLTFAKDW